MPTRANGAYDTSPGQRPRYTAHHARMGRRSYGYTSPNYRTFSITTRRYPFEEHPHAPTAHTIPARGNAPGTPHTTRGWAEGPMDIPRPITGHFRIPRVASRSKNAHTRQRRIRYQPGATPRVHRTPRADGPKVLRINDSPSPHRIPIRRAFSPPYSSLWPSWGDAPG